MHVITAKVEQSLKDEEHSMRKTTYTKTSLAFLLLLRQSLLFSLSLSLFQAFFRFSSLGRLRFLILNVDIRHKERKKARLLKRRDMCVYVSSAPNDVCIAGL